MKNYVVAIYDINDDKLIQRKQEGVTEYDAILSVLEDVDQEQAMYLAQESEGCLGTLREITHDYMSVNALEI